MIVESKALMQLLSLCVTNSLDLSLSVSPFVFPGGFPHPPKTDQSIRFIYVPPKTRSLTTLSPPSLRAFRFNVGHSSKTEALEQRVNKFTVNKPAISVEKSCPFPVYGSVIALICPGAEIEESV